VDGWLAGVDASGFMGAGTADTRAPR
jgi:hypothetical protein